MKKLFQSRREFLKTAGMTAGAALLSGSDCFAHSAAPESHHHSSRAAAGPEAADYTLHIKTSPVEIAKNRIVSLTTYNGQFPGPLIRLKEGQTFITTRIFLNNCTGMDRQCRLMSTERRKKELRSFRHVAGAGLFSHPGLKDFASTTRTFELGPIFTPANTEARLVRFTSNPGMSQATMIARSFSC